MKKIFASKNHICENSKSADPTYYLKCGANIVEYDIVLAFEKTHLDCKKFDCGCIIFSNKYYPEFNYKDAIFFDFFGVRLSPGQKNYILTIKDAK